MKGEILEECAHIKFSTEGVIDRILTMNLSVVLRLMMLIKVRLIGRSNGEAIYSRAYGLRGRFPYSDISQESGHFVQV
jgi:hypothetical protein